MLVLLLLLVVEPMVIHTLVMLTVVLPALVVAMVLVARAACHEAVYSCVAVNGVDAETDCTSVIGWTIVLALVGSAGSVGLIVVVLVQW